MSVPFGKTTLSLPREILEHISFLLVAQDPLGTPSSLVPLLRTSRSIYAALRLGGGTQLYAKICRLKFDCNPVERRAGWRPGREELEGHLVQMCELLRWLRKVGARRDDDSGGYGVDTELDADVEAQLFVAFVAMMDDEGRNRAQFKHAGIEAVVDRFVRRRLYDGLEQNGNWPQPSVGNGCALWLWWIFTTRESLLRETKEEKEEIIRLVFPYMANTVRYAAALAPPTHFTLPLGPSNPIQRHIYTSQTPHGTYPLYPTLATPPSTPVSSDPASTISHPAPNRPLVLYYFNTSPSFAPPLIAPAAILLYWSRREIHGFFRNPLLPATRSDIPVNERGVREGLTREDLEEFNRHKTAKLRGDVQWDWDLGHAVLCSLQPDGTLTKTPVKEGEEPSREWDLDVARARLCGDVFKKQPKWREGSVFRRGLLAGVWAGVQFISNPPSIDAMLSQAYRSPDFNEQNIFFGARPLIVRLKEHGFVRTPSTSSALIPIVSSTSTSKAPNEQESNAKVPPAPPVPTPMTLSTSTGAEVENTVNLDGSLNNAWFPGGVGTLRWVESDDALSTGVFEDRYASSSSSSSQEAKEPMGSTLFIVDEEAGRAGPGPSGEADAQGGPVGRVEAVGAVRRGAKVSVYERFEAGKGDVHERLIKAKASGAILDAGSGGAVSHEGVRQHPGCQKCEEREVFLEDRKERMRERRRGGGRETGMGSKDVGKRVEEVFASVGLGKGEFRVSQRGGAEDEDDDEVVDVDFDEEEYEEEGSMDDEEDAESIEEDELDLVPVSPLTSVPPSRSVSVEPYPDSDSTSTVRPYSPCSSIALLDSGTKDAGDEPESLIPTRPPHSPLRIEPCDHGVEDTLLTGDLSESHRLAWGKSVWYGRVRPWDGLVGVLRVAYDRDDKPNAYMIYYGYVYGGDTWVGNWRYARGEGAVGDPLLPGFESAFVMSRRK